MQEKSLQIRVLSAGAIEPGLVDATQTFGKLQHCEVQIYWATTPAIRQRIASGHVADVLVIPPAVLDEFVAAGKAPANSSVYLGRVGVGIAVRDGGLMPNFTTADALKQALLDAESIVMNRASSGLYMEQLLERMGVKAAIEHKIVRYSDGPQMLQHLLDGKGREFGFCASIEIMQYRKKGLTLAGFLPQDIQHYTTYVAAPMTAAPNAEGAKALLAYLATPQSRAIFKQHGID